VKQEKIWVHILKCAALIVGVIVIPLAYSFFYLDAFWNPYSKLDTVPVAVVNEDNGAMINGKFQNLGNKMVDTLKDEKSLKWVFTDSKDAKEGLQNSSKYYAVITIPNDFSKNISTAQTTVKQPATITYSSNEKRNYLASQILHSATLQLEEQVRSQVTEEITGELTDKLNEVPEQLNTLNNGLTQLGTGAKDLNTGLVKLYTGSQTMTTNLNTLTGGLNQAHQGTQKMNTAMAQIPTLVSGVAQLNTGAQQLSSGLTQADSGADQLNSGAAALSQLSDGMNALGSGASKIRSGARRLSSGAGDLSSGASSLSAGTRQYVAVVNLISSTLQGNSSDVTQSVITLGTQYMQKAAVAAAPNATAAQKADAALYQSAMAILGGNDKVIGDLSTKAGSISDGAPEPYASQKTQLLMLAGALSTPDAKGAAAKFAQSGASLIGGASSVASGASSVHGGASDLADGASTLSDGADQLVAGSAKVAELQKGITQLKVALDQLSAGGKQVAGGTGTLVSNTAQLAELQAGVKQLDDALAQLSNGSSKLYAGSKTLHAGIGDAKNGTVKLDDGISTAQKALTDKIAETKTDLKATQGLDKYSGKSVSIVSQPYDAVPNYGTAFAPYFLSLSMWVGALMMLIGIYLDPSKRIKKLSKGTESVFVRIAAFYAIGIAQSLLLAAVLQNSLGLHVNNQLEYYLAILLGSMVFISIVQFLIVYLGDIGKFLTIIFLILQLTSCGGTFPMETVPDIFNKLYRFMPMTYTVELLREVISGGNQANVWKNAQVLLWIFIVFSAATILFSFFRKKNIQTAKTKEIEKKQKALTETVHA